MYTEGRLDADGTREFIGRTFQTKRFVPSRVVQSNLMLRSMTSSFRRTGSAIRYGDALPLDSSLFTRCLKDAGTAAVIQTDEELGRRLGVKSTPTFSLGELRPDHQVILRMGIESAQTVLRI